MNAEKDEAYYLKSLHLALVRQEVGGIAAADSHMFNDGCRGLLELGWTPHRIEQTFVSDLNAIRGKATA